MKNIIAIFLILIVSGCKPKTYLIKLEVTLVSGTTKNFTVVGNGDFIDFWDGCLYNIQPQICGVSTYRVIDIDKLPD